MNDLSHLILLKTAHWLGAQNNHIAIRVFYLRDSNRIHLILEDFVLFLSPCGCVPWT